MSFKLTSLRQSLPSAASTARAFSTCTCLRASAPKSLSVQRPRRQIAPYPPGPSQHYKQSNKGLYGGVRIQFGNNVSEDTETKTRRKWKPNIRTKRLYSYALRRKVYTRVSTRVLRTIDKVGGLDEYLLGQTASRIKSLGMGGWKLRCMIMRQPTVQKRLNDQRKALGLPTVDYGALRDEMHKVLALEEDSANGILIDVADLEEEVFDLETPESLKLNSILEDNVVEVQNETTASPEV